MTALAAEAVDHRGALQHPAELAALLSILTMAEAHVVLEIGTWTGGSAWAWSQVPTVRHIVTVDMDPRSGAAEQLATLVCRADQVTGDSTHPDTVAAVYRALDGFRPDVLVIDGGHEYRTARHDWDTYMPTVAPGGLVVMHDTQGYPGVDSVQVPQLWAEVKDLYRSVELVGQRGGPAGTGLIWM